MPFVRLFTIVLAAATLLLPGLAVAATYASASEPYAWLSTSGHTSVVWTGAPGGPAAACTGGSAASDDDISEELPIGFSYTFGTTAYTTARVMSNGRLQFNNTFCQTYTGPTIPDANLVRTMRVYGEDIDPGAGGSVTYATTGTSPNRKFVVTWTNVPEYGRASSTVNLQIVLHENGDFVYQWGASSGLSVSSRQIGWELTTSDYGTYTYTTLASLNGTALRWSLPRSVLSGTVFEDPNYGGGAGRSRATASGVAVSGATVELYNSSGSYVSSTTTASDGSYSFTVMTGGNHFVRVASTTVASTRSGSTGSLRGVLTYRTTATSGSAVAVTDNVGGTNPAAADPATASSGAAFNTSTYVYSAGLSGTAHAVTPVTVTLGTNISGLDAGFNFDTVTNTNDSGQGSLRQAITNANTLGGDSSLAQAGRTAGVETIIFMISNGSTSAGLRSAFNYTSAGVASIAVASALPSVTQTLAIDATTQPGFSTSTYAPVVEINGAATAAGIAGLVLSANNCLVEGLVINRFGGNGITLASGTSGHVVSGNYIGTNAAGTAASANGGHGVDVRASSARVGGTNAGDGNVLSGNTGSGVYVNAATTTITGNLIGTNAAGTGSVGNQYGVRALSATSLTIGGTTSAAANTISGNSSHGVYFEGGNVTATVQGNRIGRNSTNTGAVANGGSGVHVFNSASVVGLTGGSIGGTATGAGNILSGNSGNGFAMAAGNASQVAVLGNSIYGNGGIGIDLGGDGITSNNATKTSGQPNLLMDFPIFTAASVSGTTLTVSGYVGSAAGQSTFASSRVEVFLSDNAFANGSGQTYLGTLTTDASGNFSGSFTVSGVTLTNGSSRITGTATDTSNNTSEFGPNVLLGYRLAGTVFEDLNYGGGAGRSRSTSAGAAVSGARVEIYTSAGAYSSATSTAADGGYSFTGLAPGSYHVRVVSGTVLSTRSGASASVLGVMTYRTNASSGTAVAVTDYVGGTNPALADPGNGSSGTTLNTSTFAFSAGLSGTAHAVAPVTIGSGDVTGMDFGFNFSTVVNTNDSGQGSLRQFLTNSSTLGGQSSLAQSGSRVDVDQATQSLPAGYESSIFMISGGSAVAGLRAGLASQLSSGVAVINLGSTPPAMATSRVVLDGGTQTANVGNTNSGVLGTGGTVGVDAVALKQLPKPDVQLSFGSGASGLAMNADSLTVRGLALVANGNTGATAITVANATSGAVIEGNLIGSAAAALADPGSASRLNMGVTSNGADNGTLQHNLIAYTTTSGVRLDGASAGWTLRGNELRDGGLGFNDHDGIVLASATGARVIGNLITGSSTQGVVTTTSGANALELTNNTISGNGVGPSSAAAIQTAAVVARTGASGVTLDRNIITANYGAGVAVNNGASGVVMTRNLIHANGTVLSRNGSAATGQIDIDLNSASDNANLGTSPFITANDSGDGDSGGNNLQNYPVLTAATLNAGTLTVTGTLNSNASSYYRIEFFATSSPNSRGNGGGSTYLGSANVPTDGTGNGSFTFTLSSGVPALGTTITATATRTDAAYATHVETSEFSANVLVRTAISGTVYEDLNYGGGAGRSMAAASGAPIAGARVELYDSTGSYSATTSTASDGSYSFSNLAPGSYHVRVVSASVLSTRSGSTASLLGVMSYRVNASSGAAVAVTDFVGGTNPAVADPGNGSAGTALSTSTYVFSSGLSGTAHAVAPVTTSTSAIGGVDFGFTFSTVSNANDSGQGSLRQAITNANTLGGDSTLAQAGRTAAIENIVFMIANGTTGSGGSLSLSGGLRSTLNLFTGGVATLALTSALPALSTPMVLDARAQPGWTSLPLVELNGSGAGSGAAGFTVSAAGSTVAGFTINRFAGNGISVASGGNTTTLRANLIGLNAAGTAAAANGGDGISVSTATGAVIGGSGAGQGNVIGGNTGNAISLTSSSGHSLLGNLIGLNAAGSAQLASTGNGIVLSSTSSTTIGGIASGAGNTVSLSSAKAITITGSTSTGNTIRGNAIYGSTGIGIDLNADGITANDGAKTSSQPNLLMDSPVLSTATISGTTLTLTGYVGSAAGQSAFASATVDIYLSDTSSANGSGRTYLGTLTANASGNFSGSLTGVTAVSTGGSITAVATDASGNSSEFGANALVGLAITGTVFEDLNYGGGAGRSLSGAGGSGVGGARVELYTSAGVYSATTTTAADGSYALRGLAAGSYYVRVVSSTVLSTRTGSTASLVGVLTYRTNASSGSAVDVTDQVGGTTPNLVDPGNGSSGTTFNTSTFIFSAGLSGTAHAVSTVTLSSASVGSVDFGFNFNTVVNANATGQGSLRQVVTNANTLGADASLAQSGRTAGIEHVVFMIGNGSSAAGLRSSVSLFSAGVATITPGASLAVTSPLVIDAQTQPGWSANPIIEVVGTGSAAGSSGLAISAGGSTVRGLVINRWPDKGITLTTAGSNTIQGNWIGLGNAGTAASANTATGVLVSSNSNTIGGTGTSQGNVISGNGGAGIQVDSGTSGTVIVANRIGTNAAGTAGVANAQEGITLFAAATVGGVTSGQGNTIAYNTGNGLSVRGAVTGATIRGNAIFSNTSRGIDLGNDGVSANNGSKSASLPNQGMDAPVTVQAVLGPATLTVTGYVGSAAGQATFSGALVDVYESDGDSSGYGEGSRYLGTLTADSTGWFTGTLSTSGFSGLVAGTTRVTATATDASGNTSEFGINITTTALAALANGGFESSSSAPGAFTNYNGGATAITGWVIRRGGVDHIGNYWTAAEGNNSVDMSGGAAGGLQQTVLTVPGQTYTLAFAMAANVNCGTTVKTLSVSAASASGSYTFSGSGRSNTAMGWQDNTLVFTATSEATTLIFDSQDANACGPALDYVRVLTGALYSISGTVFEDRNYGGGAGRSLAGSSGSTVNGARVELYDSTGAYVANTATAGSGTYSFSSLPAGNYHVRVVSSSVLSTRTGASASLIGVLTYRTTASSGSAVAVTDFVGGTAPGSADPGNASGGTTLNTSSYAYSAGLSGTAHAIAPVTITSANVGSADFGFNFSTVVNTSNSGQGSLRQAITNANTLGGDSTLAQAGRTAAVENIVFMIANGSSAAGLRSSLNYTTGGVATITPSSAMTTLSTTMVLDARTQPGWSSAPVLELNGTSAGAGVAGLTLSNTGSTVAGFTINRFGGAGISISSGGSHRILANRIGSNSAGTAGSANGAQGIVIANAASNTIGGTTSTDANLIRSNTGKGVVVTGSTSSGNAILGNAIFGNANPGIDLADNGISANDGAKTASQPNLLMDAPVVTAATLSGTSLTLSGYVGSAASQSAFANARVEFFIADTTAAGSGQGQTYLGALTADASGNFSGTLTGVSGITAGTTRITGTATDTSNNTSEFGINVIVYNAMAINGTVFEDVNYGGGAGRSQATSGGVAINGARVELYASTGAFVSSTATAGAGAYSFSGLTPGTYHVRVVSSTVQSSRTGSTPSLLGVLTYKTTASSGSAVAVTDGVGGTNPALADPGNGSSGTTLNTSSYAFSAGLSGTAHAASPVTLSTADISSVSFGFNFSTVVNTNDSGQGSLRQAITNANTLGGDSGLVQSGRTAAVENLIFMIGNGSSAAGLRSSVNLFSGGVATIAPTSALPSVVASLVIDARTQPGWSSAPVLELNGSSAGSVAGITLAAGSSTVAGFTVNRFGGSGLSISGGSGHLVAANWIGSNNTGTAGSGNGGDGIRVANASANTIGGLASAAANVIRANAGKGVVVTGATSSGNAVVGNTIFGNGGIGIDLGDNGATANDGVKTGSQPNLLMDAPVFTSARARGTALTVTGYIGTAAGQSAFSGARIEVFMADNDGSGFGEGQVLLGSLTADGSGNFSGTLSLTTPLAVGTRLSATATDTGNNTSEFGPNFASLLVDFVVNHIGDEPDDKPGDGLCASAKGLCTLRAALEEMNAIGAQSDRATIAFELPDCKTAGDAACVIAPQSALPVMKTPLIIDGSTQPNYDSGTCAPMVDIDGSATASGVSGLVALADRIRIQSLVIRRFGGSGITLSDSSAGHEVLGNRIGTDATGLRAEPNGQFGIEWRSRDSVIGGKSACEGNLLSGNQVAGVLISTRGGQMMGNRIGPTADDRDLLPSKFGIYSVDSNGVTIGGEAAEFGNVVAGHSAYGLYFEGSHEAMTVANNRIHGNKDSGIAISGSAQVNITTNSIWENGGLGIDLGIDGVDSNTGTPDPGRPNAGMNQPVITGAGIDSAGTTMTLFGYIGTGTGQAAFAGARVEIFKAADDGGGYGEGQVYLGTLTADANGQFTGSVSFASGTLNVGDSITATATDANGNTSEFGPNWVSTTVAALTPAGFNAFDSTTAPGSITGNLVTRTAGVAGTVDVIALNSAGTGLHSGFTGTVALTWVDARNDTGGLSGSCRSSWTDVGAPGAAGSAAFVLSARTTVTVTPPAAATRVMRLKMSYTSALGATTTACSSDAFAAIPASLTLAATDSNATAAGTVRALNNIIAVGGVVHRAGRPFTVTATARDALGNVMSGYDGTPVLSLAGCLLPAGCSAGTLAAPGASAVAGVVTNHAVTYAEVGAISLQMSDNTYAAIDAGDTALVSRTITSAAASVGRFVPDSYAMTVSVPGTLATANAACLTSGSGATFFGQGFGWAVAPQVTVTAQNAAGATTALWAGALQTLGTGSASPSVAASSAGAATLSSSLGSLTLASLGAGQVRYSASATDRFVLDLPAATQQVSTTPTWTWSLSLSDSSEAGVSGNPTLSANVTQSGVGFDNGAVFHSGRLALSPAHGDARSGVRQLVQLQRWTAAGWVTMTEDRGCITVQNQHLAVDLPSGVFGTSGVCAAPLAAAATTRGGRAWLPLPATPGGEQGRLTTRLAGTSSGTACTTAGAQQSAVGMNLPWLMGGAAGTGPVALATWGKANRDAVLRRETW